MGYRIAANEANVIAVLRSQIFLQWIFLAFSAEVLGRSGDGTWSEEEMIGVV